MGTNCSVIARDNLEQAIYSGWKDDLICLNVIKYWNYSHEEGHVYCLKRVSINCRT